MSTPDRKAMLARDHPALSIRGQCRLLGIARSGVYRPAPANDDGDAALMRRIDAVFPLPLARPGDRPAKPSMGSGYHVHSDRPRLPLPGRDHRLGEPGGARLAAVEHHGYCLLCRRAGRGAGTVRQTGHLQHRPGEPVHQRRFHRAADERRHPHLDGRPRSLDGQCVHRTAVTVAEIRGRSPQGLCRRPRGTRRHRRLDPLLPWRTPAPGAGRPDTHGGVARGRQRRSGRQRCGHDAALGRRYRVAHMPTATTTATTADDLRGVSKKVGADPASNQQRPSGGPHPGVHFSRPGDDCRRCAGAPVHRS